MTHRIFNLDYGMVNAFDTGLAAHRFIKKTPGELKVLCRHRFYFQRNADGASIHVILNATRSDHNVRFLDAANSIADHIEREIEKAEAEKCSPMI